MSRLNLIFRSPTPTRTCNQQEITCCVQVTIDLQISITPNSKLRTPDSDSYLQPTSNYLLRASIYRSSDLHNSELQLQTRTPNSQTRTCNQQVVEDGNTHTIQIPSHIAYSKQSFGCVDVSIHAKYIVHYILKLFLFLRGYFFD